MLIYNADGPVRIDAVDGTQPGLWRNCRFTNEVYVANVHSGPRPDLTDPATLGCLLALVEAAWSMPVAAWYPKNEGVCSVSAGRLPVVTGRHWTEATKAEALVAALEAAP